MASIFDVGVGQRCSFEVYPASVLGGRYQNVVVEGFLSPQMAVMSGFDIVAYHANVYSTLPAGVPDDPYQYSYVVIRHDNGQRQYLGEKWIRNDTIEVSEAGRVTLVFQDKTQADLDRMMMALSSNGYTPSETRFE